MKVLGLVYASSKEEEAAKKKEEEERDGLKADWLHLLFTDQSVAAMSPEAWAVGFVSLSLLRNDDALCATRGSSANSARGSGPQTPGRRKKLLDQNLSTSRW